MWILSLTILAVGLTVSSAVDEYKLVWSDEFNGKELDHNKWEYETGCDGWWNNQLECSTNKTDNVRVSNGHLIIHARVDDQAKHGFTSGRIHTKTAWTYGRTEARARLPVGRKLWPGIWMLPQKEVYGKWAASGEIDIMEARGHDPHSITGTIHYGGQYPNNTYTGSGEKRFDDKDFGKDMHTFTVEWTPDVIKWFVDGHEYHHENINRDMWSHKGINPYHKNGQPFDQDFHFMVSLAVGGVFFGPGPYIKPEEARQAWRQPTLELDWIRVYQKDHH